MVRSAAAVLALLILPGFASAQQAGGSHTVVDRDTLWDLAARYYGNPFDWRRIWTANQGQIADPNLILPGQVIIIPGIDGPMPPAEPVAMAPTPAPSGEMRTIFYRDSASVNGGSNGSDAVEHFAVAREMVYSAPWLIGLEREPAHAGTLVGRAGRESRSGAISSYERVELDLDSPVRVGDQLLVYTVARDVYKIGRVVSPRGIVTIATVDGDAVTGVLSKRFGRVTPGSYVGPMPEYALDRGQYAEAVQDGPSAMVMAFETEATILDLGELAFLDVGRNEGVSVGDEFALFNSAVRGVVDGSLQVIGVSDRGSTVRVVGMRDAVFDQGTVVRLTKKMR